MVYHENKDRLKTRAKAALHWYSIRRGAIHRWTHILIPLGFLIAAVALRVSGWGWVELIQHKAFDAFFRLKPRIYEQLPVRIVDIDDESLSRLGQWPWPRTQVARLVRRLNALGASTIAFDAVFAEPDRTSPASILPIWPQTAEVRALRKRTKELPDHDRIFAKAISEANVVTGFVLTGEENRVMPASKASFAFAGDGPLTYLRNFPGAVTNLPELEKAASGNGSFSFIPEQDGMIRRAPMLFRHGNKLFPSLSAEAIRVAQGVANYAVKSSGASGETGFGAHTGISKIKIGSFIIPTDATGRIWVYFTKTVPERTIPVWRIFEKDFDPAEVEGAIIFVGTSASGLKDLRTTPLNPAMPGVEIHANIAEQILSGTYLSRPDWADGAEVLYMLALGLILLVLLPLLGAFWCALVGIAGIAAAVGISWHAFSARQYLLDPVFPCLAVIFVYMSSSLISYLKSETERRQVRNAFNRYMHPKLVAELAKHPEKLRLGGETRDMTILFCDIRGFTTISEQFDAHGLTQMINRFLTPMTEIIMERLGYIDKYIGDCIMAFWNAPLDDADHASNACVAAISMIERLTERNKAWRAEAEAEGRKYIPINIGIGLNTGPCCVGNLGADQRFNYSVLGDDVNLSSRLEGQSKTYGVNIVIGPRTRNQAPGFATLELDLLRVKGKTVPVHIYTLLGGHKLNVSENFQTHRHDHDMMIMAYRSQKWKEAREFLEKCRHTPLPLKVLYDLYDARISDFEANPPDKDWDGTFTATSK